MNNRVGGTLRIATVYSVGLYELTSPLRRFLRAYPQVKVHLDYSRSSKIQEDVLRGSIDFGILAYPARRPYLVVLPFAKIGSCSSATRSTRSPANKQDLAEQDPRRGGDRLRARHRHATRHRPRAARAQRHAPLRRRVDNIDTIKRFVVGRSGDRSRPAVQSEVKGETLCVVHFSDEKDLPAARRRAQERQAVLARRRAFHRVPDG